MRQDTDSVGGMKGPPNAPSTCLSNPIFCRCIMTEFPKTISQQWFSLHRLCELSWHLVTLVLLFHFDKGESKHTQNCVTIQKFALLSQSRMEGQRHKQIYNPHSDCSPSLWVSLELSVFENALFPPQAEQIPPLPSSQRDFYTHLFRPVSHAMWLIIFVLVNSEISCRQEPCFCFCLVFCH